MTLDELEQAKADGCQEGLCRKMTKEEMDDLAEVFDKDDSSVGEKLLDDCVTKVLRYLFGKSWDTSIKEKSRKKVKEIISKGLQLEVVEQTENDLGETLDLLEDSLFLMERVLARHDHTTMNVEMVNHMETVAEHLEQWGLGDSKQSEHKVVEQMKDRFRD